MGQAVGARSRPRRRQRSLRFGRAASWRVPVSAWPAPLSRSYPRLRLSRYHVPVPRTDRAAASCEVPAARPLLARLCPLLPSSIERREVHLGDRLVATAPSQVASQWEAPRPAKKRHDCLPVTAQQQQQRYADEESDRRRSTNWWSTVLSDADIRNGGEVDQVDSVDQVDLFVDSVHRRGACVKGCSRCSRALRSRKVVDVLTNSGQGACGGKISAHPTRSLARHFSRRTRRLGTLRRSCFHELVSCSSSRRYG